MYATRTMVTPPSSRNASSTEQVVAVDIGGTSIRAGLVDVAGELHGAIRERVSDRSPEGLSGQLCRLLIDLEAPDGLPVCVGLPGAVCSASMRVLFAPNLGWHDVAFQEVLSARLGRRVHLLNDLNAITVGEAICGAAKGSRDTLCVFVGTGVGMGAVVGGRLLVGSRGLAGEIGHTKIESHQTGRLCGCGERGCLEAYVAGRHLGAIYTERLAEEFGPPRDASAVEKASRSCGIAQEVLREAAMYLARGIGNVAMTLDSDTIVLGGGVLQSAPSLYWMLVEALKGYSSRESWKGVQIERSQHGDDAGIIGAGLVAHGALD